MAWLHPCPTANAATPPVRGKSWLQPRVGRIESHISRAEPRSEARARLQPAPSSGSTVLRGGSEHMRAPTSSVQCPASWLHPSASSQSSDRDRVPKRSWLQPSASSPSSEPRSQGAEPKRCRVAACLPDTVNKAERNIYLDMATIMMATETTDKEKSFRHWHVNPQRIANALAAPCQCTGTGVCQAKTLSFDVLCEYVNRYHSLTEQCKACLLANAYDTAGPRPDDRAPRTAWHLLGVRVCITALQTLLGHGSRKIYNLLHRVPDMREGTWSVQPRDQPQRRACDQFFAELYMSAAEHLAEQRLDIDNIDDAIAHDDACGLDPVPHPVSDENGPSLDMSWNPDEALSTQMMMATAADVASWPPFFCNMAVCTTCGGCSWPGGRLCMQQATKSSSRCLPMLHSGGHGGRNGARPFASASLHRTRVVPSVLSIRKRSTEGQGMLHQSRR